MSDATSRDETDSTDADTEDAATKAKGRHEKELNEQAAEHQAEEKRAEQEAKVLEQQDKPEEPADPDQLRGEIADVREDLGDTVEALAAKTDVKAQAREKVDEQKTRAQAKFDEASRQVKDKPAPVAGVAGGVVALLVLVLFLRRRR